MKYCLTLFVVLASPILLLAQSGQARKPPARSPAYPLLGAQLAPVPEVLYAHLPEVPAQCGLVVQTVTANSVAAKIGLHRNDLLIRYQKTPIRDVKHFAGLIATQAAGQPCQLNILRQGKPTTLTYTFGPDDVPHIPKSFVKAQGPPAVRLEAERLGTGKLKVTLTCYADGSKQQTFTCTCTPDEIEAEVRQMTRQEKLPVRVRDLVDAALDRFQKLNRR